MLATSVRRGIPNEWRRDEINPNVPECKCDRRRGLRRSLRRDLVVDDCPLLHDYSYSYFARADAMANLSCHINIKFPTGDSNGLQIPG